MTCEDCAADPLGYCYEHAFKKDVVVLLARVEELERELAQRLEYNENQAAIILAEREQHAAAEASHRDLQARLLETLEIAGYDHEEQLQQGPLACVEHLTHLALALERRLALIWTRNVNLVLLRMPDGGVQQCLGEADLDRVAAAWTEKACKDAHKHTSNHRAEIERSEECACYYCLKRYPPAEIRDWIDEHQVTRDENDKRVVGEVLGQTARCPRCGIDSVLGDASGFALTDEFMRAMQRSWFKPVEATDATPE